MRAQITAQKIAEIQAFSHGLDGGIGGSSGASRFAGDDGLGGDESMLCFIVSVVLISGIMWSYIL